MVDNDAYRPGFGLYQVIDRESGQVIGDIGFHSRRTKRVAGLRLLTRDAVRYHMYFPRIDVVAP
jgi:hypothetical protein